MAEITKYEGDLKVFSLNGEEWVVARDADDARAVYLATGVDPIDAGDWDECDPAKTIKWDDQETGVEPMSLTYAELARRGRGYLGSANY